MKLTTGVNFNNILGATFLYKRVLRSFSLVAIWLCKFWQKTIGTEGTCKMLMKLTTGANFNNILLGAFLHKSVLQLFFRYSLALYFFFLQNNISTNVTRKMLVKLSLNKGEC